MRRDATESDREVAGSPTPAGVKCGVERWPVKTFFSDDRAGLVDFTPRATTVDSLRGLPDRSPPSRATRNARMARRRDLHRAGDARQLQA
jgi:hypothetical protein